MDSISEATKTLKGLVCDSAVMSGSLQVKIPNSREIRVYDDVVGFSWLGPSGRRVA